MLVLKLTKDIFSSSYIDILDSTGIYNALTNLGGYGVPNVLRASSNLGIVAALKGADKNQPLVTTITAPTSGNVNNVTKWRITLTTSGWIKVVAFIAPTYSPSVVYNRYDVVYDPNTTKFYFWNNTAPSLTPGTLSTTLGWAEVTDGDIVEKSTQTDIKGFYRVTLNDFNTEAIKACIGAKAVELSQQEDCNDCIDKCIKNSFRISQYRYGAESLAAIGNYVSAQIIIEKASEICGDSTNPSCGC